MNIQAIATQIGIQSRDINSKIVFHSQGMVRLSLADLLVLERAIRQEVANEIAPPKVILTSWPPKTRVEVLRGEESVQKDKVTSLARKVSAGSNEFSEALALCTIELQSVQVEVAELA